MRSHLPSPHRSRLRRGRLLVESCVAIVLLAGGSTVALLIATSSARLVDAAVQHDAVQRGTASYLAPLIAAPCLAQAGTLQHPARAGVAYRVSTTQLGHIHARTVLASWRRSPLALARTPGSAPLAAPQQHQVTASGWCQP
jgi:hypothetical protein